jgi:hypothetical protein
MELKTFEITTTPTEVGRTDGVLVYFDSAVRVDAHHIVVCRDLREAAELSDKVHEFISGLCKKEAGDK